MLCEKCKANPATTYLKRTINGQTTEQHLCAACAAQTGWGSVWNDFGAEMPTLWGNLFAEPSLRSVTDPIRCECCGHTFGEISRSGKMGCPQCYTTFYDRLLPTIRRLHGKTRHTGKLPQAGTEAAKRERELESLKKQLAEAIEKQEYETCAVLRDRIREQEGLK